MRSVGIELLLVVALAACTRVDEVPVPVLVECTEPGCSHPSVDPPCEDWIRLWEAARGFDEDEHLTADERDAFARLAQSGPELLSFRWLFDGAGQPIEPEPDTRALWTLLDARDRERAFAALILRSAPGSRGHYAGFQGLHAAAPDTTFESAVRHFEHTGAHFTLHTEGGCLVLRIRDAARLRESMPFRDSERTKDLWESARASGRSAHDLLMERLEPAAEDE